MTVRRQVAARLSWSLADQVLASATNFALMVLVARAVPAADFGAFSIGMAGFVLAVFVARGLSGEPLLVRYAGAAAPERAAAVGGAMAATLAVAATAAVLAAGLAALLGGLAHAMLLVAALVLPGVLLQDHLRYAFLANGRPAQAFANDLLWTTAQLAGMAVVLGQGTRSVPVLMLVWGLSGTLAALAGLVQLGRGPDPARLRWWWREHRDLCRAYVADNGLLQATNFAVLGLVGAVAGAAAAGGIRAAVLVFSPLTVLAAAAASSGVAELTRVATRDRGLLRRRVLLLACGLGGLTAAWGAGALLLPDVAGQALFGRTWTAAEPLLHLTAIDAVASLFVVGPFVGLRVLAAGGRGLRVRAVFSAVRLVVAGAGALAGGAAGAATGFAAVAPIQMAGWWWQFDRALTGPAAPTGHPTGARPRVPATSRENERDA